MSRVCGCASALWVPRPSSCESVGWPSLKHSLGALRTSLWICGCASQGSLVAKRSRCRQSPAPPRQTGGQHRRNDPRDDASVSCQQGTRSIDRRSDERHEQVHLASARRQKSLRRRWCLSFRAMNPSELEAAFSRRIDRALRQLEQLDRNVEVGMWRWDCLFGFGLQPIPRCRIPLPRLHRTKVWSDIIRLLRHWREGLMRESA